MSGVWSENKILNLWRVWITTEMISLSVTNTFSSHIHVCILRYKDLSCSGNELLESMCFHLTMKNTSSSNASTSIIKDTLHMALPSINCELIDTMFRALPMCIVCPRRWKPIAGSDWNPSIPIPTRPLRHLVGYMMALKWGYSYMATSLIRIFQLVMKFLE